MIYKISFQSDVRSQIVLVQFKLEQPPLCGVAAQTFGPDLDEHTLHDTLEGATNLKEAMAAVIRSALDCEMLTKALKDRIETMRAPHGSLEPGRRVSGRRLWRVMEADFTASLGPPSVAISGDDLSGIFGSPAGQAR